MWLKCKLFSGFPRICLSLLLALAPATGWCWGPQGHRVAGNLTWHFLAPETRVAIRELIGDESLADASTWADRMRDNPSPFWQKTAGPYHYVTVPPGKRYSDVGPPSRGDAMTALSEFRAVLQDPAAPAVQRQLAFRFALHIIQDLHQPLHVGNGRDRGGNTVAVIQGGKVTNLHRIWDSTILAHGGRSDAAWAGRLKPAPEQVEAWLADDPETWITESAALRDRIYPSKDRIDEVYLETWLPVVERRLAQSAVRAAKFFDAVIR